jgi:hypothetical protein
MNALLTERKRQRTVDLVKQAVDTVVEQRKQDGTTRISLNTIVAMARQQDLAGQGIAPTSILENEEAYAYYKRHRTAPKPVKQQPAPKKVNTRLAIKADRDPARAQQRYMKLNWEALVDQLILIEQEYAQLHKRWLTMNDQVLDQQGNCKKINSLMVLSHFW